MRHLVLLAMCLMLVSCQQYGGQGDRYAFFDDQIAKPKDVLLMASSSIPVYSFEEFQKLLRVEPGKTYVVNFWATWCKPCVKEIPYFEQLSQEYKDDGVEVVLVSLDFPKKVDEQLIPFVKKNKLQSHVLLLDDPNQNYWIPKVDPQWSGAIPATLIFNENKREFHEKSFTFISLEAEVQRFLN